MKLKKIEDSINKPYTALLYCAPGVGKSTAIGLIAEHSDGNTLVLDVDRTISRTLAKGEVVKDTSKVIVAEVDNIKTFESWKVLLKNEITPEFIKTTTLRRLQLIISRNLKDVFCQTLVRRARTRVYRHRRTINICSFSLLIR